MNNYTYGPSPDFDGWFLIYDDGENEIASVEGENNAGLIVRAVNAHVYVDLLEMCKRLRTAITGLGNDMNWVGPMADHFGDGILTDLNLLIDEAEKEAA